MTTAYFANGYARGFRQLGYPACLVLVAGLWLPWSSLTVVVAGHRGVSFGSYEGQSMGDDFLSLPTGWIAAIAGVTAFFALRARSSKRVVVAGLVATVDVAYTLFAMPSTLKPNAALGFPPGALLGRVGYEWGVFVVGAAAIVTLVVGWRMAVASSAPREG